MSRIVERLAERALGALALAQPLLRPVYAASPEPGAILESESQRQTTPKRNASLAPDNETLPIRDVLKQSHLPSLSEHVEGQSAHLSSAASSESSDRQIRESQTPLSTDQILENHKPPSLEAELHVARSDRPTRPSLADVIAHLYPDGEREKPRAPAVGENQSTGGRPYVETGITQAQPPAIPRPPNPGTPPRNPHLSPQEPRLSNPHDRARGGEPISATDVHVSIGKIVLHAPPLSEPSKPAPRVAQPTSLSLDAYLARRRGERA